MAIHLGTAVEQEITISNTAGDLADPDTLTVILRAPDGSQASYVYGTDAEVTRESVGVYVFRSPGLDQATTPKKLWWIAWVATGTDVTVTDEASVEVCPLHVALNA